AYYAVWLVLGIFCGLLNYGTAYRDDAKKMGRAVCATVTTLLTALSVLFFLIFWNGGSLGASYLAENITLRVTVFLAVPGGAFFVAVRACTFLAHKAFQPGPKSTK